MNKYELAVVLSAKLEEEKRELQQSRRYKGYITRYNGVVTNVDDWGRRDWLMIQKSKEAYYYFIQFDGDAGVSR